MLFRKGLCVFHIINSIFAFLTLCIMTGAFYSGLCDASLKDTALKGSDYQRGPGGYLIFLVFQAEAILGFLCWRGAYSIDASGTYGGMLSSSGGWKLGLAMFLSFGTLFMGFSAISPLSMTGWIQASSDNVELHCGPWWCLQLRGKDGEKSTFSGWAKDTTIRTVAELGIGTCTSLTTWGDLEQSIQAIQFWGSLTFAVLSWCVLNHGVNLMCDWLKIFRQKMFCFHFLASTLAFVSSAYMLGAHRREYCGKSLKDETILGANFQLGYWSFGNFTMIWILEAVVGVLCLRGAYGKVESQSTHKLPTVLTSDATASADAAEKSASV
jgi:hypothetical protein